MLMFSSEAGLLHNSTQIMQMLTIQHRLANCVSRDVLAALAGWGPVIYARHRVMTFPLPASELGRPTIVVLELSGYQPT